MRSFYSKYKVLPAVLAFLSTGAFAQNNYVATTPSASPGIYNTLVGVGVGTSVNAGSSFNTFIGGQSGKSNTTGSQNTFIGYQAGFTNTTLGNNTFVGYKAGYSNSTGRANVFIGSEAGLSNTTGIGNMFVGQQSGANNSTGDYNLFIGNSSGSANTSGVGNTGIGDGSALGNTTGIHNTAIGRYAGLNNTSGSNNTFLGFAATSVGTSLSNVTTVGYNAQATASNSVILGDNSVNVGIGNSAPNNKLEITSSTDNRSGLRFTKLTRNSTALLDLSISLASPIVKVLTVDTNGDVVLAGLGVNLGIGGRVGAPDTWTMNAQNSIVQSVNDNPVSIGGGISRLPAGYKLFVAGGVLTEKVKVAVKNSNEWADYVFADNYKLRSLNEVGRFIQKNKHLPGIPSASEVAENGIDLGKMDAKLLEKIEELTLYMIELKKENQQMKKAMRSLSQNKRK